MGSKRVCVDPSVSFKEEILKMKCTGFDVQCFRCIKHLSFQRPVKYKIAERLRIFAQNSNKNSSYLSARRALIMLVSRCFLYIRSSWCPRWGASDEQNWQECNVAVEPWSRQPQPHLQIYHPVQGLPLKGCLESCHDMWVAPVLEPVK